MELYHAVMELYHAAMELYHAYFMRHVVRHVMRHVVRHVVRLWNYIMHHMVGALQLASKTIFKDRWTSQNLSQVKRRHGKSLSFFLQYSEKLIGQDCSAS